MGTGDALLGDDQYDIGKVTSGGPHAMRLFMCAWMYGNNSPGSYVVNISQLGNLWIRYLEFLDDLYNYEAVRIIARDSPRSLTVFCRDKPPPNFHPHHGSP